MAFGQLNLVNGLSAICSRGLNHNKLSASFFMFVLWAPSSNNKCVFYGTKSGPIYHTKYNRETQFWYELNLKSVLFGFFLTNWCTSWASLVGRNESRGWCLFMAKRQRVGNTDWTWFGRILIVSPWKVGQANRQQLLLLAKISMLLTNSSCCLSRSKSWT